MPTKKNEPELALVGEDGPELFIPKEEPVEVNPTPDPQEAYVASVVDALSPLGVSKEEAEKVGRFLYKKANA